MIWWLYCMRFFRNIAMNSFKIFGKPTYICTVQWRCNLHHWFFSFFHGFVSHFDLT
ncbi:hypothetical protein Hanom_Chr09g00788141 [Helianthus anomalus]